MLFKKLVVASLFYVNLFAISPHEEKNMRIFEVLYKKQLVDEEQKIKFFEKNFRIKDGTYFYTFPNNNIENVYKAYISVVAKNNFGKSILHEELPKTSKAFKKDSTRMELGYILSYAWSGDKKLVITDTRFDGENLCGIERLVFIEQGSKTTLEASFEQYCFD